jgi:hypothetical protein
VGATHGGVVMKKKVKNEDQLSLFETNEPEEIKKPNVVDFARARFDQNPEMTQEEYKRWITFLVNVSLKSID